MHAIYLLSVWLHILAAIIWIGGMSFLTLVVVPWMRHGNRDRGSALLRETGPAFSRIGWICFGVFLVTGTVNLGMRGVRPGDFVDPGWLRSPFGATLLVKLAMVAVVMVMSWVHDFRIGPRAVAALEADPDSPRALALRQQASVYGRVNALLALFIVMLGVVLVRGLP